MFVALHSSSSVTTILLEHVPTADSCSINMDARETIVRSMTFVAHCDHCVYPSFSREPPRRLGRHRAA